MARFRPVFVLFLLAAAAGISAQPAGQTDPAAEVAAQIEAVRGLIRGGGNWNEAIHRLAPLLARLMAVPDAGKRIELSAEVFLLRGIASAGLGDEQGALREFQSLFALGAEVARAATKNLFDPKILPLLDRAERESRGEDAGYFLAIVTDPPGAAVAVNGREIGEAPVLFQADGPAAVTIEIQLKGYQSVREEVELTPGGLRREYTLSPAAYSLRVKSDPPGAAISLDGQETGKTTEAEVSGLDPGVHIIRLELAGYRAWEGSFEVSPENPGAEVGARLFPSSYYSEAVWGGQESSLLKNPAFFSALPEGGFIVADSSDDRLKLLDGGGRPVGGPNAGTVAESGLAAINGLAVSADGRLLVSDPEQHVVFLFQPDGRMVSRWGSFGAGPAELNTPAGLAVDAEGVVYIADTGNNRIQLRSLDGIPAGSWGESAGGGVAFRSPRSVAVRGDLIYVLDLRRVYVLAKDGTLRSSWEPKGPDSSGLVSPAALAVDGDGCVFLADPGGHRILKFDPSGEFLAAWGSQGSGAGELDRPCGLVCGDRGRLFVLESGNHRIQVFRPGEKPPEEHRRHPAGISRPRGWGESE